MLRLKTYVIHPCLEVRRLGYSIYCKWIYLSIRGTCLNTIEHLSVAKHKTIMLSWDQLARLTESNTQESRCVCVCVCVKMTLRGVRNEVALSKVLPLPLQALKNLSKALRTPVCKEAKTSLNKSIHSFACKHCVCVCVYSFWLVCLWECVGLHVWVCMCECIMEHTCCAQVRVSGSQCCCVLIRVD